MYDVVSLYAHCMLPVFPNPSLLKCESITDVKYFIKNILPHYEGNIKCTVQHPKITYGTLPYRNDKGRLTFPDGIFSGCWNFPEIRFAIEKGVKILSMSECTYAEAMPSPFTHFVDRLYQKKFVSKSTGDKLGEMIAKSKLVNLYGKFGQRNDEKTIYIPDIDDYIHVIHRHQQDKTFIKLHPFNDVRNDCLMTVRVIDAKAPKHCIPPFPSYVTSYGRVKMVKKLYEFERFKPAYCDTDSIALQIDDGSIKSEEFLGGWSRENKIITKINGLKNYEYGLPMDLFTSVPPNSIGVKGSHYIFNRTKGVPSNATFNTRNNTWEFSTLMGSKEALRRGLTAGVMTKRTKKISGKYDKRVVLENGETKPITI